MTAPQAVGQRLRSRGRRPGAWLRRIGGAAVTMALIVLGLGAGLWLGSPASAAPGSLQVDMGDGHFVSSTSTKLLDISALAPGGSVTGTMKVRDTSGNDGAHRGDAIKLKALHVTYGESCPLLRAECRAASRALGEQISFTVSSLGAGGTGTSITTLKALGSAGAVVGTGMTDQDTLTVAVTASLDFDAVGNDVQYGSVRFDLALELTGLGNGSGNSADGGPEDLTGRGGAADGAGSSGDAIAPGDADAPGAPQVAGENRELPPGNARHRGGDAGTNILVLGANRSELPNTGVPVAPMLAVGGGVLLGGLGLLWTARQHRA